MLSSSGQDALFPPLGKPCANERWYVGLDDLHEFRSKVPVESLPDKGPPSQREALRASTAVRWLERTRFRTGPGAHWE